MLDYHIMICYKSHGICATDKCAPFDKDSFTVRIPIMAEFIVCYWFCGVDLNKPLINHLSPQIKILC